MRQADLRHVGREGHEQRKGRQVSAYQLVMGGGDWQATVGAGREGRDGGGWGKGGTARDPATSPSDTPTRRHIPTMHILSSRP